MLTNRNQLPVMQAMERPHFETMFSQFKTDFLNQLRETDSAQAAEVALTLDSEGELITKVLEAFSIYMIANIEAENEKARQMLPSHATGSNLDHVVAMLGLERQIIKPGNADAIPPIAPVLETDSALLTRFWLAPHAPAAGTRLHYKFQMLTIDAAPFISVDKPATNQVRLTYTYDQPIMVNQIRDGNGRRTAPGEVTLTVLVNSSKGVANAALLAAVTAHFKRDDVGAETDFKIVQSAQIIDYVQEVNIGIVPGPDTLLIKHTIEAKLREYAQTQWRLGGSILRSYIDHIAHSNGAQSVTIIQPTSDIYTTDFEAPFCASVSVNVDHA